MSRGVQVGATEADPVDRGQSAQDLTQRDVADKVQTTNRPWGHFEQFVANEPVTVKTITVQPGHRLSLQRHGHRAELWQILDHPLEVVVGEASWVAESGELVWIPVGCAHRVANHGERPGRVLEIAFGDFAEGDIERLEDDYQRE